MDCIFNATFFQPRFVRKCKMFKKKHERLCGCGHCPCLWSGGGGLQAPQQACVMQQGHLATSSPLGLQPQHSKPLSWMYLFETSIFKTWRFSVIKQNVLMINQRLILLFFFFYSYVSRFCLMQVCVGGWECVCLCVCVYLTTLSRCCVVMRWLRG